MIFSFIILYFLPSDVMAQANLKKHEILATKLVNQCANIHENDLVLISGSVRDADLMHELSIQTSKVGAHPLISLQSQQAGRRYYDVVPESYDSLRPEFDIQLYNILSAAISISYGETIGLFKDVSSDRIAKRSEAYREANELFNKNNIRTVNLGNGLYPTEALAKQFGITKKELSEQFWNGVNTDYQVLQKIGASIKSVLESGKKIRITSKNGTDLNMKLGEMPVFVSDGIISEVEMKKGSPFCNVWLPAGEVYLVPVSGSVSGKVVVDRFLFQGEEIEMLTLEFVDGKLVSMSAKSGIENYKDRYDASGEGKDEFAFIDIGINPNVKIIPDSKMVTWMASGMITIGHGNNSWAGGENTSAFGSAYFLTKTTLIVDDNVIVEKGILKH